jgi:hypothetical protein
MYVSIDMWEIYVIFIICFFNSINKKTCKNVTCLKDKYHSYIWVKFFSYESIFWVDAVVRVVRIQRQLSKKKKKKNLGTLICVCNSTGKARIW